MHRSILKIPTKPTRNLLNALFFSHPFCPFATMAAVDHSAAPPDAAADAVSVIIRRLTSANRADVRGISRVIGNDPEFKTLISGLGSGEIDGIVDKLRIGYPETALDFFYMMKNECGVAHSRDSWFSIAYVLAAKQRFKALKCHLLQMVQQKGSGSAPSLCELLSSCFKEWDSSETVWNILALSYLRCKMMEDALFVLHKMKDMNMQASPMTVNGLLYNMRLTDSAQDLNGVVSPGIVDLSRQSLIQEAIASMLEAEIPDSGPSIAWFNNLISGFCKLGYVNGAKSFWCMMYKCGFLPDVYSYNILIHGLCIAGSVEEALDLTYDMENHGLEPDRVTYNTLLKGYTSVGSTTEAWKVINQMLPKGIKPDVITYTIMMRGYCQAGNIEKCFKLREHMLSLGMQMSSISFADVIGCLCNRGNLDQALVLFREMKSIGLKPDVVIYSILIHGMCRNGLEQGAFDVYNEMCSNEIMPNSFTHQSFLSALSEKGRIKEAKVYFDSLMEDREFKKDIFLWNIMIHGYAKHGYTSEAVQLYQLIMEKGISPSVVTFNSLLDGFCKARRLTEARNCFNAIGLHGLVPTAVSYTILINAFCEEGNVQSMLQLLQEMEERDINLTHVTYTVVIKTLCKAGQPEEAVNMLHNMVASGVSPDETSYNIIIQCLCRSQNMMRAYQLCKEMGAHNLQPNYVTYNILMGGLCSCWNLKEADELFKSIHNRNIRVTKVFYTTLINAHCAKGNEHVARRLFEQMVALGYEVSIRDCSAAVNRLSKRHLMKDAIAFLPLVLSWGIPLDRAFCSAILHCLYHIQDRVSISQKRVWNLNPQKKCMHEKLEESSCISWTGDLSSRLQWAQATFSKAISMHVLRSCINMSWSKNMLKQQRCYILQEGNSSDYPASLCRSTLSRGYFFLHSDGIF